MDPGGPGPPRPKEKKGKKKIRCLEPKEKKKNFF